MKKLQNQNLSPILIEILSCSHFGNTNFYAIIMKNSGGESMVKVRKMPVVVDAVQTDIEMYIETLEGVMKASPGDWIITGVNGEKYPVKQDIFQKTYEILK